MQINDFLGQLRRRLRNSILFEGFSRLFVIACLTVVGFALLDASFNLPAFIRLLVLLAYLYILFDTIYIRLWRPLNLDMADKELIALLERKVPELNGRAFVAHDDLPLSEEELAAMNKLLDQRVVSLVIPAPHMRQWLVGSAMVVLLLAVLFAVQANGFGVALQRLLMPFSEAEWDRSTVITGQIDGETVIAKDQPFVFAFERLRGEPNPLEIKWVDQDGVEGHKIFEGQNKYWRESLQLGPGQYEFAVTSGDSKPVRCSGTVVERPRLAAIEVEIIPPAYAMLKAEQAETFDLRVLPGSTLRYQVQFLEQPGIEIKDMQLLRNGEMLATEQQGPGMSGSVTVSEEAQIALQASDQYGITMKPAPEYTVKTLIDHPPQVQLSGPRRSESVRLEAEVALRIDARDDFGLQQTALMMRREAAKQVEQDQDKKAIEVKDAQSLFEFTYETPRGDVTEKSSIAVKDYAAEHDRLVIYAQAQDANDVTGPGIGKSNQIELLVVSEQVLRRELQRMIGEAREKVQQSRDALMPGIQDEAKLKQKAKQSASLAQKSDDQLEDVLRRWSENKLPEVEMKSINAAQSILQEKVSRNLLQVTKAKEAQQIDRHLQEVYRLLSTAVNSSALPQELGGLIERQKELSKQSKAFVLKYSVQEMDEAAKHAQQALADRQRELSNQLREWQQKLSENADSRYEQARETAAKERPDAQLAQASRNIESNDKRQKAVGQQEEAVASMERIYRAMQGSSGPSIGEQLGELAKQQEELAKKMQAGQQGEAEQQEQRKLEELTKRLLDQLKRQNSKSKGEEKAQKHMNAAQKSQQQAQQSMKDGKKQDAQTEATVAANLLKQAQRAMAGKEDKEDEEEGEEKLQILEMLKEMRKEQTEMVSSAVEINEQLDPDKKIPFRQKRQIAALDAVEKKMLNQLRDEAIPLLKEEKMQIAIWGLKRLDAALVRTHEHLQKPALGERGLRLAKAVLLEIDRLIQIVEKMPRSNKNQEGQGQGEGEGGGPPPFPKVAELNLIAQAQELILHYTAARYGNSLAAQQRELSEMINHLASGARKGSRSRVLLERAKRAAKLAEQQLRNDEFGASTQHHQRLAVLTIEQIMREAKKQQGGGQGKKNNQNQQQSDDQNNSSGSKPKQGQNNSNGSSQSEGSAAAAQREAAEKALEGAYKPVKVLVEQKGIDWLMKLPPKVRNSLLETNVEELPAGARELFQRYLEILEDIEE